MPSKIANKRRRQRSTDEDYAETDVHSEIVIPTPSIDQVLQNLASNALATTNDTEQDEDGEAHVNEEEESDESDDCKVTQRQKQLMKRRQKDRRQKLLEKAQQRIRLHQLATQQMPSSSNNRSPGTSIIQGISANLPGKIPSIMRNRAKQPVHSLQIGTATKKVNTSVITYMTDPAPPKSHARLIITSRSDQLANNGSLHSSTSSKINTTRLTSASAANNQTSIEATVNSVIQGFCTTGTDAPNINTVPSKVSSLAATSKHIATTLSSSSSSSSNRPLEVSQQRYGQHSIAAEMNRPKSRRNLSMDDEIVILDSDEDEEEATAAKQQMTEEAAPFCKSCASEIPLILKSLDRLDGIVSNMVWMVKNELKHRPKSNAVVQQPPEPHISSSANSNPIMVVYPVTASKPDVLPANGLLNNIQRSVQLPNSANQHVNGQQHLPKNTPSIVRPNGPFTPL